MKLGRFTAGLLGLLLVAASASVQAQSGPQLTASVSGSTVNLTWTEVPGATAYGLQAMANGAIVVPMTQVTGTSLPVPGVPPGTYTIQMSALVGGQLVAGNAVTVSVAAAPAVTPAPTNLSALVNDNNVVLSWTLPTPATGLVALGLQVLTGPGGAVATQIQIPMGSSFAAPSLPDGIYTARVVGFGIGGLSVPSNEITFQTPGCSAPAGLPLTTTVYGTYVAISWPQIPGAIGYRLDVASSAGGPGTPLANFAPNQTTLATFAPLGTYHLTLHSQLSCGASLSSAEKALVVDGSPGNGPRRASGTVSRAALTAEVAAAANAVAAQYPGDLRNSCREHGGNNNWLFRLVQRLRQIDSRYGLNWKRGNFGDMSQDVVAYNYSNVPDDQASAPHMLAWDVIAGHCGSPSPWAADISNPNGQAGWTLLPYLQRGFTP